ncbi:hypothetical protein NIES22_04270 [Calothrix brevissima NIES-22]|nr:hypothetical protein NIES22_04270 [Calothrix brevissima NIES-22]
MLQPISRETKFKSLVESSTINLLREVELLRISASRKQEQKLKGKLGQFFTPAPVAELMAGMFNKLNLRPINSPKTVLKLLHNYQTNE